MRRTKNPWIDITPYEDFVKSTDANLVVGSDDFKIAVVILYGAVNRNFNATSLAWHTCIPHRLCRPAVRHLKQSKIWIQKGRQQKHEFINRRWINTGKDSGFKVSISFWMDVCVAIGNIVKVKNKYGLKEWAKPSYSKKLKSRLTWIENKNRQLKQ